MRLTAWVHGRVQGVGMRWWVRSRALELGLVGWARNLEDGRVEVVAQGPESACCALLALLEGDGAGGPGRPGRPSQPSRPGHVDTVVHRLTDTTDSALTGFVER